MTNNEDRIHEAKSKDIFELAQSLGLTLVGSGNRRTTVEHESLTLYSKGGRYDDYTSFSNNDGSGSTIDLVMSIRNCTFVQALEYLVGGSLPSKPVSLEPALPPAPPKPMQVDYTPFIERLWGTENAMGRKCLTYANKQRGIGATTIHESNLGCGMTYVETGNILSSGKKEYRQEVALTLPFYDSDGQIMGVRYRVINPDVMKSQRMRSMPGSSFKFSLFGHMMPILNFHQDTLFVAEGEFNTLAIRHLGYNCVSLGGQLMSANETLIEYSKRFKKVVVWFDELSHSERIQQELKDSAGVETEGITSLVLGGGKEADANDILLMDWEILDDILSPKCYDK